MSEIKVFDPKEAPRFTIEESMFQLPETEVNPSVGNEFFAQTLGSTGVEFSLKHAELEVAAEIEHKQINVEYQDSEPYRIEVNAL